MSHIARLAAIGNRLVGTAGDAAARDYIRAEVRECGLVAEEQLFPVVTGTAGPASLTVGDGPAVPCAPMFFCRGTPAGGVTGKLVSVGRGGDQGVGPHLQGSIVLWTVASRLDFLAGYPALLHCNPLAIIVIWPAAGIGLKHQQLSEVFARADAGVPTVCIKYESGIDLVRSAPASVTLRTGASNHLTTTSNLIVDVPGGDLSDEIVLVGAHHDTAPVVEGAIDNGSGVAIVLELLRAQAAKPSRRTLRFVLWGAEKAGMVGSRHYLSRLSSREMAGHRWTISIDGLGTWLGRASCTVAADDVAVCEVTEVAQSLEIPADVMSGYFGSDSEIFVSAGVPALSFGQSGPALSWLHTESDTLDAIDPAEVDRSGRWISAVIERMGAGKGVWSGPTAPPPEIAAKSAAILTRMGWLD